MYIMCVPNIAYQEGVTTDSHMRINIYVGVDSDHLAYAGYIDLTVDEAGQFMQLMERGAEYSNMILGGAIHKIGIKDQFGGVRESGDKGEW